ncbi:hypothetical protein [Actinomadura harenae]|uniref:hypothetical protein n=1 Tax=Actinomadura harenae TaxID=2483351 RepID=UPI0011C3F7EB|nr:hypothetical protein [Actinomadura harenae]
MAEPQPVRELDPWRAVAVQVVACNGRLLSFQACSGDRSLPAPLRPTGLRPSALTAEVRRYDDRLSQARQRYRRTCAAEALQLLADLPPTPLDKARQLTEGGGSAESAAGLGARVRRRLAVLEPETSPEDRASALELAARALGAKSGAAAAALADRLATAVREINAVTRRRRGQAVLAAAYLQVIRAAGRPTADGWLERRLISVLHGGATLNADLLDAAERLRVRYEERAEQEYLLDRVQGHFDRSGVTLEVDRRDARRGVLLSGRSGRVLLAAGEVTGGPPGDGPTSHEFRRAFLMLRLCLGRRPVWNPGAFP